MGHSEKEKINEILKIEKPFYQIGDLKHIDSTIVEEFIGKSRAFIKVQEGCNFRCSYCIIPSVRGDARSHKEETILAQIEKLAANGFGEFIFDRYQRRKLWTRPELFYGKTTKTNEPNTWCSSYSYRKSRTHTDR